MLPTEVELRQRAAATGFLAATLEKVERLADLLALIGDDLVLQEHLVLKGGTALNLLFGPPQRLSVDLDFNLVSDRLGDELSTLRAEVERRIELLAVRRGYRLQLGAASHAGRVFHLSYSRIHDRGADRIRVDLNYLWRIPLGPIDRRPIHLPDNRYGPHVPCLSFDELAAGKLIALLDRTTARDLWDTARLTALSRDRWPGPQSQAMFVAYSGVLPKPLTDYSLDRLATRTLKRDLRQNLEPMLLAGTSLDAPSLLTQVFATLEPLLALTAAQIEFCANLQRGSLDGALLFPDDPELATRVNACPALRWKAQNAAAHHHTPKTRRLS